MWADARSVLRGAVDDFAAAWRTLVVTDLAYKAIAFAILTPLTALFLRWLLARTGSRVAADVDIARFFLTTPEGYVALIFGGAIVAAISALESGCLMAVALAASRGARLRPRTALVFAASRSLAILRLALNIVLRLAVGLLPFLAAVGLIYATLLRGHDINYYLSRKPPEFIAAVSLAGIVVAALAAVLIRAITRWALSLPIVLFEDVSPRHALAESARRSQGYRGLIATGLALWAAGALGLTALGTWIIDALARLVAPLLADWLIALILFLAFMVALWSAITLAIAILNSSFFALVVVRLWLHAGPPGDMRVPADAAVSETEQRRWSRRWTLALAGAAALIAVGVSLLVFVVTRGNERVLVIAHRGASEIAPENSLSAFRLALEEQTDFVELDVQESSDGVVVVVHDSDLMKVAQEPKKIWEQTAAELQAIDIGTHKGEAYRTERVPTLAQALELCKGRAKMMIELKSYGHGQSLEEKVVRLVEDAGMENDSVFMSLDHAMVAKMKQLRPNWTVGVLAAKAIGDPATLQGDFLAVEARMATARFIRRAHRAGKDVYVWTMSDPGWMMNVMSRGADGLITDTPALAREVVARRAKMSDAQRLLAAVLLRAGARVEVLEAEDALRP